MSKSVMFPQKDKESIAKDKKRMDEMKEQILELKLAKSAVLEEKLKLQEDL